MRTETTTRTVYLLHELPEDVQQKACEKFMVGEPSYDWWVYTYSDFETICDIIGIDLASKSVKLVNDKERREPKIYFSGFWSQGDGASFFGRYRYAKQSKKKIREHASQDAELHRITDALFDIQKKHFYKVDAEITSLGSNYCHSNTMSVGLIDPPSVTAADELDVQRLLRDLADWLYCQLEKEHEYLKSFESFKEMCKSNGYEFTESGVLV